MSFTADELQSFNDILEKKLAAHRREIERAFDQRLQTLRREIEQRFITAQREIITTLTQKLAEQQKGLQATLSQKLNTQQMSITQALGYELKQRQQHQQPQLESLVDRSLAAQLLAIEELLNQRLSLQPFDDTALQIGGHTPPFEAIEVQTDLPWEDMIDVFGKVLDERFARLNESTQAAMKSWEQYLSGQLHTLQVQLREEILYAARQPQAYTGNLNSMQEVFQSIEQLGRLIESMQVAMTANNALLSNRLYHHQQLPLERAHASNHALSTNTPHSDGTNASTPPSLTGEHEEQ
ncbi:MAG: hypothetical protein E6J10_00965 [Chloroflexi bacterium]|nr:MAG: hypothetical protein E6J10_00965 [Chloroflexota bacterium]